MKGLSKGSSNLIKRFNQPPKSNKEGEGSNIFGMKNVHGDNNIRNLSLNELIEAPKEWNFYKALEDDKTMELIESIEKSGLLHPIVVWEQSDDEYMILAGHNRVRAFRYLSEMEKGKKYRKIPALIKKKNEITEEDAREIIIDTNWVQRSLSAIEKSKSIIEKYTVLKSKNSTKYAEHGTGKLRDVIAEDYNLSGRAVDEYRRLNNLIAEFKYLLEHNKISFTAASKVAGLNDELQRFIYDNYSDKIHRRYIKKINMKTTKEELIGIFEEEDIKRNIHIEVRESIMDKYKNMTQSEKLVISKKLEKIIQELKI